MKSAAAILFSLLLVWAQAAPAAMVSAPAKAACDGCDCRAMSCCPSQAQETAPTTIPAGRDRAQMQLQFLAVSALLFCLPANDLPVAGLDRSFSAACLPIPLFVRDCAYLI